MGIKLGCLGSYLSSYIHFLFNSVAFSFETSSFTNSSSFKVVQLREFFFPEINSGSF